MTYKADRPSLKRPDTDPWTTKLWDRITSTFWLLFLVAIFGGLSYLAYQAVVTEMAAGKPGSRVEVPK